MSFMPLMWIIWAVFTAILLVLLLYRGTLTRYEEDQIFLDDSSNLQQQEQSAIVNKVARMRPFLRIAIGATCVMSVAILGLYVWDALKQF
jgi:hypothetical protein